MRHKDANQSIKATWLGSADAAQGCKPVSLLAWLGSAKDALLMRHKDANQSVTQGCKPALGCALMCYKDVIESVMGGLC